MNITSDFEIIPHIGAGELSFGMSHLDVEKLWGKPEGVTTSYIGTPESFYLSGMVCLGYTKGINSNLVHIGFDSQIKGVRIGDIFLFKRGKLKVLQKLILLDPHPFECVDSIVFMNLGISLTGYVEKYAYAGKTVSVFPSSAWNYELDSELKPFHIENY
jgi:hypothetical protein